MGLLLIVDRCQAPVFRATEARGERLGAWHRCDSYEDFLRAGTSARGAAETEPAGAAELLQSVRANELLEGVDLLRGADELEDDRVRPEVRDLGAEHVGQRHQLRALARRRRDLQQRQLALD